MGVLGQKHHVDAINRAGWNAKFATRAQLSNDGVAALAAADDCIHGACLDTQGAADTVLGVDACNVPLDGLPAIGVQRGSRGAKKLG